MNSKALIYEKLRQLKVVEKMDCGCVLWKLFRFTFCQLCLFLGRHNFVMNGIQKGYERVNH